MTIERDASPRVSLLWPRMSAILLALYALLGGMVSITGWVANLELLTDWDGSGISIQPNSAIAAMAAAAAVLLMIYGFSRIAAAFGILVLLIGASSILQIVFDLNFSTLNTFFMFGRDWGRVGVIAPGRMGTPGSASWTLIGSAIILLTAFRQKKDVKGYKRYDVLASALLLCTLAISTLSITGFIYGAEVLYTIPRLTVIALQTATFILAIAIALILSIPDAGPLRMLAEDSPAGILVRRATPVLILLPFFLGLVRLSGERAGLYDLAFGTAARTLIEIALLIGLLWLTAGSISRQAKREAEQAAILVESEERRKLAQEAGKVGIFDWDHRSGKTYWSETMWSIYGHDSGLSNFNPDEAFWSSHLSKDDRERVKDKLRQTLVSGGDAFQDEFRIVLADGSVRWINARAAVLRDAGGDVLRMYGVNTDITSRKEIEEKIKISDNQLRLVTNAVPALISYVDKTECYRFANQRFTDWFGIPNEEIIGKGPKDIFGPETYNVLKPYIDGVLSGRKCNFESTLNYKHGGGKYVNISYIPDIGVDGKVHGYYGLTHDLTDLKHSEDLLRSSEERLGLMMDSLTDYAIFSLDGNGVINSWNKGAEIMFGYSNDEVLGQPYAVLFTAEDVASAIPKVEMGTARRNRRASDERWLLRKDGESFFASGVLMPVHVGEAVTGYVKIVSDLTEKKRHAEELQRAYDDLEDKVKERTRELAESNEALVQEIQERETAEKERIELLGRLVSSQEFERRRIARDLHDQMGQRLTALRLKLASLHELAPGSDEFTTRVNRLQEIAELLDSEVSFLTWELRPTTLDDLGLLDAVAAYVNEWSRHYDISADFHSAGLPKDRLDQETETHLYRISQEALNNIAKHAEAEHVTVLLERREQSLILIIEDDGKGFDPVKKRAARQSGKGLGLVGMEERAILIGGDIEIESSPGKGTTIYVRVPFSK
ncbi:MAG: PAS domain S-box protein [Chloracidobacterium sp.]|nr:PAS domain S-box protein [Chloracidobacterium sp.]